MSVAPCGPDAPTSGVGPSPAYQLVASYEGSLAPAARRLGGVHYTPPALARFLVETAIHALGRVPRTICDPTCGAGAFLLAAADALADRGVDPVEVVERRVVGGELDPEAAAVARAALERWAEDRAGRGRGAAAGASRIEVGDRLLVAPDDWQGRPAEGFDLVVGNPPFLSQLASPTARSSATRAAVRARFGPVGAYADTAALFLLGALDLVGPGGVVAMVQPQSFLAARDTSAVRAVALEQAELCDVWSSDESHFEAAVHVCAPVLRRRSRHTPAGTTSLGGQDREVRVHWGAVASSDGRPTLPAVERRPTPHGADSWGPLFATALGLPAVRLHGGPRLGTLATTTAGFRDEFYALLDASVDVGVDAPPSPGASTTRQVCEGPALVTVGMLDPGRCTWGERARRFGGRAQLAPRLDVARLRDDSPRVAAWAAARQVPKVLVATQTKVVEAAADPLGEWVPVTPTISVEPLDDPQSLAADTVWRITAALLAPPVSATALATHLGAGWSPGVLRWSASSVLQVELPFDETAWQEGTRLAQELATGAPEARESLLDRFGRVMCRAHGLDAGDEVHDWWLERAVRATS